MKKFEEEINKKVGTFDVVGHHNGVCCLFEEVKALGKDWVSPEDHQAEIAKLNSKIDWLHGLLDERNEEVLQTVKRLNEAQSEIPEVPQFVADWLEYCKEMQVSLYFAVTYFIKVDSGKITEGSSSHDDYGFGVSEENSKLVREWFTSDVHNQEKLAFAFITNFYIVAKEKRFYLKNKLTGCYLRNVIETESYFEASGTEVILGGYKTKFTQQEIDSMETGSYEKIGVQE